MNLEICKVSHTLKRSVISKYNLQVRCKVAGHCTEEGTRIVVTDYGEGDHTDFILSVRAYTDMATSGMAKHLLDYGVVDVEYRRIPCRYYGYNLMIKVHENSRFCNYLAILPIYQSGAFDVEALEVWQVRFPESNSKFRFNTINVILLFCMHTYNLNNKTNLVELTKRDHLINPLLIRIHTIYFLLSNLYKHIVRCQLLSPSIFTCSLCYFGMSNNISSIYEIKR